MSNAVSNYRIRDLTLIELGEGVPAGLFYADFPAQWPAYDANEDSGFHGKASLSSNLYGYSKNFEDTSLGYLIQPTKPSRQ